MVSSSPALLLSCLLAFLNSSLASRARHRECDGLISFTSRSREQFVPAAGRAESSAVFRYYSSRRRHVRAADELVGGIAGLKLWRVERTERRQWFEPVPVEGHLQEILGGQRQPARPPLQLKLDSPDSFV